MTMIKKLRTILAALSRGEKIIVLLAGIVLLVSSAFLLSLLWQNITYAIPGRGGAYREGMVGQPSYVNPVLATSETDKSLIRLIFSSVDDLAEKIEPLEEGRKWRVRLRADARWQDNTPLTSDDIIFTVSQIQNPNNISPLRQGWQGVSLERVSGTEVIFKLGIPYAFFPQMLHELFVVPRHLFQDIPLANWRISDLNLRPIGSGPYAFDKIEIAKDGFIKSYTLKASENYWGDPPLITQISFRFFKTYAHAIAAFNKGEVDGIGGIPAHLLSDLQRTYQLAQFQTQTYYAVFLNSTQNLALKDDSVRKALDLLVDRKNLINTALSSYGSPVTGPFPTFHFAPSSADNAADPIALLEEAGWQRNEEGARAKTIKDTSIPLSFTLTVPDLPFLVTTASQLKAAWSKAGIAVQLEVLPLQEVLEKKIKDRSYEAILFGNNLSTGEDIFSFWHSSQKFYPGLNLALYESTKADELIETIRQTLDAKNRRSLEEELAALITSHTPAIFLYAPSYLFVADKQVKGIEAARLPAPEDRLRQLPRWYLYTKRELKPPAS
ncbi:hypothetical protein D6779_11255 [Candidatus Parcubacteria bacterium]|nr:MAG: hypothetical protein D6779_11255 [Candidatus Parcubacteria bacterium]